MRYVSSLECIFPQKTAVLARLPGRSNLKGKVLPGLVHLELWHLPPCPTTSEPHLSDCRVPPHEAESDLKKNDKKVKGNGGMNDESTSNIKVMFVIVMVSLAQNTNSRSHQIAKKTGFMRLELLFRGH